MNSVSPEGPYFLNKLLTHSGGSKNEFPFSSASLSLILSPSMMKIVQAPTFGIKQAMKICNAGWLNKFWTFPILSLRLENKLKLFFDWKILYLRSWLCYRSNWQWLFLLRCVQILRRKRKKLLSKFRSIKKSCQVENYHYFIQNKWEKIYNAEYNPVQ